ncbi:hypothetical protein ACFPN2_19785 [Steroidobacter flavus]|uniref:Energy transducer TonB n=1 Tax=Steroidobacter flavus TaxID=1842136 RepID=A0ABV8SW66_9GAMM
MHQLSAMRSAGASGEPPTEPSSQTGLYWQGGPIVTARDFLYDERVSRPAIVAVVVGMHLAALLIPLVEKRRVIDHDFQGPGYVRLILEQSRPLRLPPPPKIAPPQGIVMSPPPPALAPLDATNAATPAGSAMAPPDWKQSGADAAADAARDNYRTLGPPPKEPQVKLPPSPFAGPPRHKFAETDEDSLRNPILWLSEHCYMRPRDLQAQPGDPFGEVPMTFCSFSLGKKQARGDLFEHLRKPQPVP